MKKAARKSPAAKGLDIQAMHERAEEAVSMLKAIANQNRLLLLCQMVEGERSVNELAALLELPQSVVSQHLSLLRREGLVKGRREAQSIYYAIEDERVHKLMGTLFTVFCVEE